MFVYRLTESAACPGPDIAPMPINGMDTQRRVPELYARAMRRAVYNINIGLRSSFPPMLVEGKPLVFDYSQLILTGSNKTVHLM